VQLQVVSSFERSPCRFGDHGINATLVR
jgi:hypothetical protein